MKEIQTEIFYSKRITLLILIYQINVLKYNLYSRMKVLH